MKNNVLIDTSIILDGIENITVLDENNNIFVSDVILRELDRNKGAEGSKGYNAREFFRQFNKNNFTKLEKLPGIGKAVLKNDTLTEGSINSGAHVYTISRKWYRAKDINDSRIIEIAKDYEFGMVTLDQAQSARAKSQGVEVMDIEREDYSYIFITISLMPFFILLIILLYKLITGQTSFEYLIGDDYAIIPLFIICFLLPMYRLAMIAYENKNRKFGMKSSKTHNPYQFKDNYFEELHRRQDYGLE